MVKVSLRRGGVSPFPEEGSLLLCHFESESRPVLGEELGTGWASLIQKLLKAGDFEGKLEERVVLYLVSGRRLQRLALVGLGKRKEVSADRLRRSAAAGLKSLRDVGVKRVAFPVPPLGDRLADQEHVVQVLTEAILLGLYCFDRFKTKGRDEVKSVDEVSLLVGKRSSLARAREGLKKGKAIASSVTLARDLVSLPGNEKTPELLARRARTVARECEFKCTVLGPAQMERMGMGALLAVAQGSAHPSRFIVLEHGRKKGKVVPTIVLIGKGITFDSGGISLKPSQNMDRMKDDMAGGAAVLGTMRAAALLHLPVHLIGLIPAVENLPSGSAYRPGDVLTSLSGQTVEVITTDAEGRLVLADALAFAARYEPTAVIDLATLTGACVIALGDEVMGMMGNDEALLEKLKGASEKTGEKAWQLPLPEEYDRMLKSDVADMKNVGGRPAGTITGGLFLKRFVGNFPWVHLDIAGPVWAEKETAYIPKGATGVGVRLLVHLLREWS